MKVNKLLYNYAIKCIRTYEPQRVYHPIMIYLTMFTLLLLLTKGLYDISLLSISFTIGIVIGRYISKKINQLRIVWAIIYSSKQYINNP